MGEDWGGRLGRSMWRKYLGGGEEGWKEKEDSGKMGGTWWEEDIGGVVCTSYTAGHVSVGFGGQEMRFDDVITAIGEFGPDQKRCLLSHLSCVTASCLPDVNRCFHSFSSRTQVCVTICPFLDIGPIFELSGMCNNMSIPGYRSTSKLSGMCNNMSIPGYSESGIKIGTENWGRKIGEEDWRERLGRKVGRLRLGRSKVAGALHKPKGITVNCHRPLPVEKAVFSLSLGCNPTCQYPLFKSRVEKICEPETKESKDPKEILDPRDQLAFKVTKVTLDHKGQLDPREIVKTNVIQPKNIKD
ncbi:hypothetical protein Btru_034641 [Bulinus truncatus]|nr:hypothetical protein Btru_034641 [Bulinus truncatus]